MNQNILDSFELFAKVNTEILSFTAKPTKASSKRIRLLNNQIKKNITTLNRLLVESDKVGY